MADFDFIDPSEAGNLPSPVRSNRLSGRMSQYEDAVRKCAVNGVIVIPVTGEDSTRGLALRISRAATRSNIPVETWNGERNGQKVVFAKRLPGTKQAHDAELERARAATAEAKAKNKPVAVAATPAATPAATKATKAS